MSGFTVRSLWLSCRDTLQAAEIENALPELDWLWQAVFGQDRHVMNPCEPIGLVPAEQLQQLVLRRAEHEPLQYLLGSQPFLDFELAVAPGVLIPRADTECVALQAIALGKKVYADGTMSDGRLLDLCAGSGALALALAVHLQKEVTAVELSDRAFSLLQQNIERVSAQLHCPKVQAVKADIFQFQQTLAPGSVGLIVSNPPYLTESEMRELQPEVQYEPSMALFGGQDGLDFYRHIAVGYREAVASGGVLIFEIGSDQAEAVRRILEQNGWRQVAVLQDEQGRDRCVSAMR